MMNAEEIIELERRALKLQNEGDLLQAAELFRVIVSEDPSYEHGLCFYCLAACLEDLGELEEAKRNYEKAIKYDVGDDIRWGGYASFLYLHGEPKEAFEAHLKLIELKERYGLPVAPDLIEVLKTLGQKSGLSDEEVVKKLSRSVHDLA